MLTVPVLVLILIFLPFPFTRQLAILRDWERAGKPLRWALQWLAAEVVPLFQD